MFETGYWLNGQVVSNFNQSNEAQIAFKTRVNNGFIVNASQAFNLFNLGEGSGIENIRCTQVNQVVYGRRCFYGTFRNLFARTPINGATLPAFHLDDEVNAIDYNGNFAVGYSVAHYFTGVKRGFYPVNCGGEAGGDAVVVGGTTFGMGLHGWYVENNSGAAFRFNADGNHFGRCRFKKLDRNHPNRINESDNRGGAGV